MAKAKETPDTPTTLHVVIDLGSDTMKIAFGYAQKSATKIKAEYHYGKFADEQLMMQIGIPAIAFLSKKTGKWIFGNDVETSGEEDFTTVVHIKSLMTLLAVTSNAEVSKSNREYYFSKCVFPKFYLPSERKHFENLAAAEEAEKTFSASITPQKVCEQFFEYAKGVVERNKKKLEGEIGFEFADTTYSIIYPSKVGAQYIEEFTRLVNVTFDTKVYKSLSSVKSLGIYAYNAGMVKDGESFLVFDIGEEYISVAKAWFQNGQLFIDGADGHKTPDELGGINIDESIRVRIEAELFDRETFATPPAGDPGHVNEECLDSKKYQLLKDIKAAKHLLSTPGISDAKCLEHGVPIVICRDCYVQRYLTKRDLEDSIGIINDDDDGAAGLITDYIVDETMNNINSDVSKILIAGGVIETYGLADYIRASFEYEDRKVQVYTFDAEQGTEFSSKFTINENESSVYAAVFGGAIVAAKNIVIKTVLSLTYGTWVSKPVTLSDGTSSTVKVFSPFVNKGTVLHPERRSVFTDNTYSHLLGKHANAGVRIPKDEVFSTVASEADIAKRKGSDAGSKAPAYGTFEGSACLVIGEQGSDQRARAAAYYNLRTVIYSDIGFYHKGRRVIVRRTAHDIEKMVQRKILFSQGISVDPSGVADMIIETQGNDFMVSITYEDPKTGTWSTRPQDTKVVNAGEITMDYVDKVAPIAVASTND